MVAWSMQYTTDLLDDPYRTTALTFQNVGQILIAGSNQIAVVIDWRPQLVGNG